jgi:hypothetical protein
MEGMPTYRFVGSDDMKQHLVTAERCQQVGGNASFFDVTSFDEPLATPADRISVIVVGEVEIVD